VTTSTPRAEGDRQGEGHLTGFGTPAYRHYVLTALMLVYILNFIDRGLLSVVGPEIKKPVDEGGLGISDTLFGLLTGAGFAVLYTFVGLFVARVAEVWNRVAIMAVSIAVWSLMTAMCGLANPLVIGSATIGAVMVLLVCRIGVGIGEAGCTPPATSIIADYYPPKSRAAALGYYAMGVTLGTVMANLIGGPVAQHYGWRMAFFVLGLPGVLVGVLVWLTIKEPPRGFSDPPQAMKQERASYLETLRVLSTKPTFWWMVAGCTIASFSGYGIANFQSVFINREFGLSTQDAAIIVNVPVYLASAVGTVLAGFLAGRIAHKYPRAIAWIPGFGLILSAPFYWLAFTTHDFKLALFGLIVGGFVKYGYLAAQYTIAQGVAPGRSRAISTSILLFVQNLIGYGLGPVFIGTLSDFLFKQKVAAAGITGLVRKSCEGKAKALLDIPHKEFCEVAHPLALQQSMLVTGLLYAVAGIFLLIACRTFNKDMLAAKPT
jgi:MFS family permease